MRLFRFATVLVFVVSLAFQAHARKPKADQPLPAFQVGITGLYVVPQRDRPQVVIDQVLKDTPASGQFKPGDEVVAVNGTALSDPDPRIQLGNAITQAEATDGKLTFRIKRGSQTKQVAIRLEVLGAYSATWPVNCEKSQKIVEQTAGHTVDRLKSGAIKLPGRDASLAVLFLLSTGDDAYLPTCREAVHAFVDLDNKPGKISHTWNSGFLSIALGEYTLRTGDRAALPYLQTIADDAYARTIFGGWGHWDFPNPEYTRSGLVNAAGGNLFVGMMLARECGVNIDETKLRDNIRYYYQFAGYGGVPYGDQRPSSGGSVNGKTAMAAVGLGLLPDKSYQQAAQMMAVETADHWFGFEGGHTGNMTNVLWRNLATPLAPDNRQQSYRDQMDTLRWYFELCRHPEGGFRMLPVKNGNARYAAEEWGLCAALAYTTGLQNLRTTGAPPTRHSKIKPVGSVLGKHEAFVTPEHAEGYTDKDFDDLQAIAQTLKWSARNAYNTKNGDTGLPSIEYIVKHFRHYNPLVRSQAASAIGYHGDAAIPAIIKAIKSDDPRVRRAGLQGLSGYMTFFMDYSGRFSYTPEGIEKTVPHIVKILKDPQADLWEVDGALWALSVADKRTIAKYLPLITPYLEHESWWVQSAAFMAVAGAEDLATPAMDDLLQAFSEQAHVAPRNEYVRRLHTLIKKDNVPMSQATRERAVGLLGIDLLDESDREPGYLVKDRGYYNITNIRVLLLFKPEELTLIADTINQQLAQIGDPEIEVIKGINYQNYARLLIGDKGAEGRLPGQPGLINIIEQMEPSERAKFMPGLKAMLAGGLDKLFVPNKKGKEFLPKVNEIKARANAMLKEHEAEHGSVKPTINK